jgi:hypothetical protein
MVHPLGRPYWLPRDRLVGQPDMSSNSTPPRPPRRRKVVLRLTDMEFSCLRNIIDTSTADAEVYLEKGQRLISEDERRSIEQVIALLLEVKREAAAALAGLQVSIP